MSLRYFFYLYFLHLQCEQHFVTVGIKDGAFSLQHCMFYGKSLYSSGEIKTKNNLRQFEEEYDHEQVRQTPNAQCKTLCNSLRETKLHGLFCLHKPTNLCLKHVCP